MSAATTDQLAGVHVRVKGRNGGGGGYVELIRIVYGRLLEMALIAHVFSQTTFSVISYYRANFYNDCALQHRPTGVCVEQGQGNGVKYSCNGTMIAETVYANASCLEIDNYGTYPVNSETRSANSTLPCLRTVQITQK